MDVEAAAAAFLLSQGYLQKRIAKILHTNEAKVSKLIKRAWNKKWLIKRPPGFNVNEFSPPQLREIECRCWSPFHKLSERLNIRAREKGVAPIREVRVFHSGSELTEEAAWDRRLGTFGRLAASYVAQLLPKMKLVGVTWGKTLSSLVAGLRDHISHTGSSKRHVRFVALCGESLNEPIAELSSSTIAMELDTIVNGGRNHSVSLGPVPAFIPKRFPSEEADTIRKFIDEMDGYRAVISGEDALADRLDGLITSIGFVSAETKGRWLDDRLKAEGIRKEKLASLVIGDIGGVLIPQAGLNPRDRKRVKDMNARWTGVTRSHLQECTNRAFEKPAEVTGVLACGVGKRKAEVVIEAIGLISHLAIDHDLAQELDRRLPALPEEISDSN